MKLLHNSWLWGHNQRRRGAVIVSPQSQQRVTKRVRKQNIISNGLYRRNFLIRPDCVLTITATAYKKIRI